jgi:hypothetical protein
MDAGDAELLEAFDAADDVHQRIQRSDLVQRHLLRRHAMDFPFSRAEELEGANRPLADPIRERSPIDHRDEVSDVPVASMVTMFVGMRMSGGV